MSGISLASQVQWLLLWFCLWAEVEVEWITWGSRVFGLKWERRDYPSLWKVRASQESRLFTTVGSWSRFGQHWQIFLTKPVMKNQRTRCSTSQTSISIFISILTAMFGRATSSPRTSKFVSTSEIKPLKKKLGWGYMHRRKNVHVFQSTTWQAAVFASSCCSIASRARRMPAFLLNLSKDCGRFKIVPFHSCSLLMCKSLRSMHKKEILQNHWKKRKKKKEATTLGQN